MEDQKFEAALQKAMARGRAGIGTLGEKTLHAALKYYFDPTGEKHEVRVGGFIADVAGEDGILEIQTRSFEKLSQKLEVFLESHPVTLVYPVASVKWISWVDRETGEVSKRRKSPKKGGVCEILPELSKIKPLLSHPNLSLCIVLFEVLETRWLDGWSADHKKGSTRRDRVPLELLGEVMIHGREEYRVFLPENLPDPFTSRDYHRVSGLSLKKSRRAVGLLLHMGLLERTGRRSNSYLYRTVGPDE